jgi:hypothetical protein
MYDTIKLLRFPFSVFLLPISIFSFFYIQPELNYQLKHLIAGNRFNYEGKITNVPVNSNLTTYKDKDAYYTKVYSGGVFNNLSGWHNGDREYRDFPTFFL